MGIGNVVITIISVIFIMFFGIAAITGGFADIQAVDLGTGGNATRTYMQTLFFDTSSFLFWPIVLFCIATLLFLVVRLFKR